MPQITVAQINQFVASHRIILLYDTVSGKWAFDGGQLYLYACAKDGGSDFRAWCSDRKTRIGRMLPCGTLGTAVYEVVNEEGATVASHVYGAQGPNRLPLPVPSAGTASIQRMSVSKSPTRKSKKTRLRTAPEAANSVIRVILGSIEPLTEDAWEVTLKHFGHCCAYCGKPLEGGATKDHAIPINQQALGDHRPGNVVPCCKDCNDRKHNRDYLEFLASESDKVMAIEALMRRFNYTPIRNQVTVADAVRSLLNQTYQEVVSIAKRDSKKLVEILEGCHGLQKPL